MNQRGLSLVEVLIVLVVVGLVLGASLVPLTALVRHDNYAAERARMETFHNAIVGYALRNQTRERTVVVGDSPNTRRFTLPAGRPYLPCPDIDGDGYEDRVNYDIFGIQPLFSTETELVISSARNELLIHGECLLPRGVLPWKTLGINPHDRWGNRYTYEVDAVYSSAISGFSDQYPPDEFDVRMTVNFDDGDYYYQDRATRRGGNRVTSRIRRDGETFEVVTLPGQNPPIVCGASSGTCLDVARGGTRVTLDAGKQTHLGVTVAHRRFEKGDVVEGLPYVIVSHGQDGRGAVNHEANVARRNSGADGVLCNAPAYSTSAPAATNSSNPPPQEAFNFPFPIANLGSKSFCIQYRNVQYGVFYNLPRNPEPFDDIVIWGSQDELVQRLTQQGVLDAPRFPALGVY